MRRSLLISLLLIASPCFGADQDIMMEAISMTRPMAQWNLRGDTYEGLEWLDKVQTKPTREEVEAAIAKLEIAEPMPPAIEILQALLEGGEMAARMRDRVRRAINREPRQNPAGLSGANR